MNLSDNDSFTIQLVGVILALVLIVYLKWGERLPKINPARLLKSGRAVPVFEGDAMPTVAAPEFNQSAAVEVRKDSQGRLLAQTWMPYLVRELNHLMIAAPTESGKTTVIRALYHFIAQIGGKAVMLGPKAQDGRDVAAVGHGGDYQGIEEAMQEVTAIMQARYKEFRFGKRKEDFEPLFVIVDDYYATMKRLPRVAPDFIGEIASLGREANIHLIVANQSPRVQDIGISGGMRTNFSILYMYYFANEVMPEKFTAADSKYIAVLEHNGRKNAVSLKDVTHFAAVPPKPEMSYMLKCIERRNLPANVIPLPKPAIVTPAVKGYGYDEKAIETSAPRGYGNGYDYVDAVTVIETPIETKTETSFTEEHIKIAAWLQETPKLSAREVSRRLWGKDGGRATENAGKLLKEVRAVLDAGVPENVPNSVPRSVPS